MTATIHQAEHSVRPPRWLSDFVVFAATRTAPSCTSLFVSSALAAWGLKYMLVQVEAAALQLVTNAVVMTGIMDEHLDLKHLDYLNIIAVGLRQAEMAVVVEVWDSSQEPPIGPAPVGHTSGYFFANGGGKVVWTAVQYPLPRRKLAAFSYPRKAKVTDQPDLYINDLGTMQRVRVGLEDLPVAGVGGPRLGG